MIVVPLSLFGFHPLAVTTVFAANLMYQSWLHTMLIPKLGPLEGILNTPSAHRVHHATNADCLDRNYGGVLIIFDRMFGTYAQEREVAPCEFGLVKPVGSLNPVRIAFHEWIRMFEDLRRNPLSAWPGLLLGPPGWAPHGNGQTSADIRRAFAEKSVAK